MAIAPDNQWSRLATALAALDTVIVDTGTGCPPQALHEAAEQSLLIIRPCFMAIRRAQRLTIRPTGIVLVDEPGRALTSTDVEHAHWVSGLSPKYASTRPLPAPSMPGC